MVGIFFLIYPSKCESTENLNIYLGFYNEKKCNKMNGLCRLFCCGGKVTPPEQNSLTLDKSILVLEEEQIRYLLLGFSLARLGETDGVAAGGGGGAAGPGGGGGVGRRRRRATCAHGRRYPTGEQVHRHPGIWGRGRSRSQEDESF